MSAKKAFDTTVKLLVVSLSLVISTVGQVPQPSPSQTPTIEIINEDNKEEILKIDTNLIQTGVMVFNKSGKFVDGLQQEDFELKVDGKTLPISFFESVINNKRITNNERKADNQTNEVLSVSNTIGRTIIFAIDDIHMSFDSLNRTKKLVLKFIDNDVQQNDSIVIISSSGKIGFLQQFTNDKMVLKEAVERVVFNNNNSVMDRLPPPMTEYEAFLIDKLDPSIIEVFVRRLLQENPEMNEDNAKMQVRSRANNILLQARPLTNKTLSILEESIRRSAQIQGRKIVLFFSDGFLIDQNNGDVAYRLQRITDASSRSNAIIYSFDTKGLDAALPDNTSGNIIKGLGYRVQSGERLELLDGMNSLADTTGGQFVTNRNDIDVKVRESIVESSGYYLLAWQPELAIASKDKLSQIEIVVKNRPDLSVRLQKGYFSQPVISAKSDISSEKLDNVKTETELKAALLSQVKQHNLQTSMSVNYLEMQNIGASLTIALKINSESLAFSEENNKRVANVDFWGVVYNSEGKQEASFRDKLTAKINRNNLIDIFHNFQTKKLNPGLYQVRVATRDAHNGLVGNAVEWIKIPDLSKKKLATSSLILSENFNKSQQREISDNNQQTQTEVSVDKKFLRSSYLRYMLFIYNALAGKGINKVPNITVRTQLFQDNKEIINTNQIRLNLEGQDLNNLYYAAELPLASLSYGYYEIQVTVEDEVAKTSSSQRISFEVK